MRVMRRFTLISVAVAAALACGTWAAQPAAAATADGNPSPTSDILPGRILVKANATAGGFADLATAAQARGLTLASSLPQIGWSLYRFSDGKSPKDKVQELLASHAVAEATVDVRIHPDTFPTTAPNDPGYTDPSGGYAYPTIKALQAWQHSPGTTKYVAIVDSGISYDNYAELGSFVGADYCDSTGSLVDHYGHGTWVAGVAAAATNNGVGIAGVSYASPIMVVKIYGDPIMGECPDIGDGQAAAASGITWAVDHGAAVINASWQFTGTDAQLAPLKSAVDYAWSKNVLVVAPTGNGSASNFNNIAPARWYHAVAVGASDSGNHRWSGSNYGSPGVDVVAPGVDIYTTDLSGRYTHATGTSMAVPFVTGTIGLMLRRYPSYSALAVKQRLWNSAQKLGGYNYGWSSFCGGQSAELGCGVLNAYAASL